MHRYAIVKTIFEAIPRQLVWLGRYTHTIALREGGPQESLVPMDVWGGGKTSRNSRQINVYNRCIALDTSTYIYTYMCVCACMYVCNVM